jgi:hypothetical protein
MHAIYFGHALKSTVSDRYLLNEETQQKKIIKHRPGVSKMQMVKK